MAWKLALAVVVILSSTFCFVLATHGSGHAELGVVDELEKPEGSKTPGEDHGKDQAKSTGNGGLPALGGLTVQSYGCEGTYGWLECAEGKAISVTKATYGRTSLSVCKHVSGLRTDCTQDAATIASTTRKVQALCNDRDSCSVFADNVMFGGDPCPGTAKYVTVEYKCIDPVCKNLEGDAVCDNYASGAWAKQNGSECLNNPKWMYTNCWKSCTNCNANCHNIAIDDAQCDMFALRGECDRNYMWMYGYCQRSCKACPPDTKCSDLIPEAQCRAWAANGNCDRYPGWMYRNCRKSCGACVKGCYNIFEDEETCNNYTKEGYCTKNAEWMLTLCTKACNKCPDILVGAKNKNSDAECEKWREEGQCSKDPKRMLANCEKSCLWFKGDECLNAYRLDWKCDNWAAQGFCRKSPGWMMANCRRSCDKCKHH